MGRFQRSRLPCPSTGHCRCHLIGCLCLQCNAQAATPAPTASGKPLRQNCRCWEHRRHKVQAITGTGPMQQFQTFSPFTGSPAFPGDDVYSQQWCATIVPGCPVVSATLSPPRGRACRCRRGATTRPVPASETARSDAVWAGADPTPRWLRPLIEWAHIARPLFHPPRPARPRAGAHLRPGARAVGRPAQRLRARHHRDGWRDLGVQLVGIDTASD